ncbi:MAG: hypothetical protein HZA36_01965 [Parcubacteria group bacterium]|nr:hypothetical protein [Parcubacteria group bacterium]
MTEMDWRFVFILPFVVGFASRFVSRAWRIFALLCCILATLVPLVDAKWIGVREDPVTLFVTSVFLAVFGRLLPEVVRGTWAIVSRMRQRWAFVLGLVVVFASVLPVGAAQQFVTSLAVLMIIIYGLWIMVGRPRWWR